MCRFHVTLSVAVLRVSHLCCFQDNAVTLGLVDTIDTVMGHISSNLQSREPHVILTGSSSMAGSHCQNGGQWGSWEGECQECGPLAFTLSEAHAAAEINHHFSEVQYLVQNPVFEEKCVRMRLRSAGSWYAHRTV